MSGICKFCNETKHGYLICDNCRSTREWNDREFQRMKRGYEIVNRENYRIRQENIRLKEHIRILESKKRGKRS